MCYPTFTLPVFLLYVYFSAADMLGFESYFVKWCAVIMAGFVLVFMVAIVAALRIFNFQKR
jgi:hypothetical protein